MRREVLINQSMIYLPETGIQSGPTKTDNSRRVALPDETIDLLRKLWAEQAKTGCGWAIFGKIATWYFQDGTESR